MKDYIALAQSATDDGCCSRSYNKPRKKIKVWKKKEGERKEHKQINKRKRGMEAKTKESFEMQIEKIPRVHRRANGLPINSVQFNAILTLRSSSTWYGRTFFLFIF